MDALEEYSAIDIVLEFARQAIKRAPVDYVSGNNESRVHDYEDLKMGLAEACVVVVVAELKPVT